MLRQAWLLSSIVLENRNPEIAKPAGRAGRAIGSRPGKIVIWQSRASPKSSRFVKREFPPTGGVCPQRKLRLFARLLPAGFCATRKEAMRCALPNHLRSRRDKIFGPAPCHPLDGNAKARVWAAAAAYNAANRQPGQHQGPLTWASLRVLRALLWRFHGADGGGRCFPSYEKIAAAAKCCRDTVNVAIRALEDAGILTWVNRIARIRRRERDLFDQLVSVWQVVRISNGYHFFDPLERQPGRRGYKSENPTGPQNPELKRSGARLDGAQVMQGESPQPSPVPPERPEVAPHREHGSPVRARLSAAERAALIARLDTKPSKADWALYNHELEAMLLRPNSDAVETDGFAGT
jgi:hypothetical protein